MMSFAVGLALARRNDQVSSGDGNRAAVVAGIMPDPVVGVVAAKVMIDRAAENAAPPDGTGQPGDGGSTGAGTIAGLEKRLAADEARIVALEKQAQPAPPDPAGGSPKAGIR